MTESTSECFLAMSTFADVARSAPFQNAPPTKVTRSEVQYDALEGRALPSSR
jgi:hypothetical protein